MMEKVYSRPSGIFEGAVTGFCPGCMHSSVCKIVTEALDELGMVDNACYVQGVGCCGLAVTYFDFDTVAAPLRISHMCRGAPCSWMSRP